MLYPWMTEHVYVCAVLFCPTERDEAQNKEDDQEDDDCEWTISLQPQIEAVDTIEAPPPVQAQTLDPCQQPGAGLLFLEGSPQADSSTLPSSAPQVTYLFWYKNTNNWVTFNLIFLFVSLHQESDIKEGKNIAVIDT